MPSMTVKQAYNTLLAFAKRAQHMHGTLTKTGLNDARRMEDRLKSLSFFDVIQGACPWTDTISILNGAQQEMSSDDVERVKKAYTVLCRLQDLGLS